MKISKKIKVLLIITSTAGILLLGFQNCARATFTKPAGEISNGLSNNGYIDKTQNFSVTKKNNNKVDILFVIDNSGSMAEEQMKISQIFSMFTQKLSTLDWRIAITTTDNDDPSFQGNNGQLISFRLKNDPGLSSIYYIDKTTPNGNALLMDTINTGTDGSSNETGLTSIKNFLDRSAVLNSNENKFLRSDAAFSTIVVTDSDQAQNPDNALDVPTFLSNVLSKMPAQKTYVHNSSIAIPGDSTCLAQSEVYGDSYNTLSNLTGGVVASVCSPNYADQFNLIAEVLVNRISDQTLDCTPVDSDNNGAVDVSIVNSSGTSISGYTVNGNSIHFTTPLNTLDTYTIKYRCAQ